MTSSEGQAIDEADLYGALRGELPAPEEMAARVRIRLAERDLASDRSGRDEQGGASAPKGVVLRLAEWTGLRGMAASIVGPVLLPLGLARAGTAGTLAMKGLLPKSVMSVVALPFAVLMMIGFTVQFSVRKTAHLEADTGTPEQDADAIAQWWKAHWRAAVAFAWLLVLVSLASHSTARMLLFLAGLVAHALCAESLSTGRRASRDAIVGMVVSIGMPIYFLGYIAEMCSKPIAVSLGLTPDPGDFHRRLLDGAALYLAFGAVQLASVQGRSHFLKPWRLLTKGTHLDLAKFAGLVIVIVAAPIVVFALIFHFQELEGSAGERIWASRASLAWLAFCLHAILVVKRAPVVER